MKKVAAVMMSAMLAVGLLAGCGGGQTGEKTYKIGIAQFAEHGSLDNCRQGFLEGLKEEGIEEGKNLEVDYQNAQSNGSTANQIAQNYVANNVDLICAIATPMAQSAFTAADGKIPLIYTAISDPVDAGLANADKSSTGNVTGTSDKLPVEEQLKMIRAMMPEAKNIGILYTTSEVNSESAIAEYQALAGQYGFTIVTQGISKTADIPLAVDQLLPKVDCLTNLTDNTVVSSLDVILDKANAKNIPVFGSEIEQVKKGCVAAQGLDYIELGKVTGRMAAQVLKGEKKASEIPYEQIAQSSLYYNSTALAQLNMAVPAELSEGATDVAGQ